ncbi:hypothetical protein [Magnetospirillum fulvum]|uniref:hypothetical protein n=1 Tax=Magnetospirillum fulvum TaxID=1082 RepID=UPI0011151F4B|nr:hypothetical protein [Magnetospirillum fulvum]
MRVRRGRQKPGHEVGIGAAQLGKLALIAFGAVTLGTFAFLRLSCPLPELFDQFSPNRLRRSFGGGRVDPRGGCLRWLVLWRSEHPDQFGHVEKPLAAFEVNLRLGKSAGGNLALKRPLTDAENLCHVMGGKGMCNLLCHAVPNEEIKVGVALCHRCHCIDL